MKRIKFETAKLTKQAGYDCQESNGIYRSDGEKRYNKQHHPILHNCPYLKKKDAK